MGTNPVIPLHPPIEDKVIHMELAPGNTMANNPA
jgi:hypothetical protein